MSANTSFAAALQQLSQIHEEEVYVVKKELVQQCQVVEEQKKEIQRLRETLDQTLTEHHLKNEEQLKSIAHLKDCNQRLKQVVKSAKKKLKEYKKLIPTDQASMVEDLGDVMSPVLQPPALSTCRVKDTTVVGGGQMNKTCMALFESPSIKSSDEVGHTALGFEHRKKRTNGSHWEMENRSQESIRRESVETNAESCDVVIIEADRLQDVESQLQSTAESPNEEVNSVGSDSPLSHSMSVHSAQFNSGSEEPCTLGSPQDAPIHLIYSHAHHYAESHSNMFGNTSSPAKLHTTTAMNRSLMRRETRGRVRYKVLENPLPKAPSVANPAVVSSTVSIGPTGGDGAHSMSSVPRSQDSLGSSAESCNSSGSSDYSNSSSPSLLLNSQWKVHPSSQVSQSSSPSPPPMVVNPHEGMTCSLFPSTPITSVDSTIAAVTTPGQEIPKSDSQLSLDMSQSIPFSPELKDPFFPQTTTSGNHNDPNVDNRRSLTPRTTRVNQTGGVNRHLTLGKRSSPSNKAVMEEREQGSYDVPETPFNKLAQRLPPKNVILATPGVKSVDNILKQWMGVQPNNRAVHQTAPNSSTDTTSKGGRVVVPHTGKHISVSEDTEEVVPSKKARLGVSRKDRSNYKMLLSQVQQTQPSVDDGDKTRLNGGEAEPEAVPSFSDLDSSESMVTGNEAPRNTHQQHHQLDMMRRLAERAGLPGGYKFTSVVRKKADRDKLDAKACPDCQAWYGEDDGIHNGQREHLKHTCRHKHLHLPPDTDPKMWDISFPASEECEQLMK